MANELRVAGIIAAIVLSSVLSQAQTTSASSAYSLSPEASFARLHSRVDVERVGDLSTATLAGKYSSSPDELLKKVVPFSGNYLYLFPDGSYLYLFWSDIPPETIQDKGHWTTSQGQVRLASDPDITWRTGVERHYLLVRRRSHPQEILAIGMEHNIPYFAKNADSDPEFQLLIGSMMQVSRISSAESNQLKEKLLHDAWCPEFYLKQNGRPSKK